MGCFELYDPITKIPLCVNTRPGYEWIGKIVVVKKNDVVTSEGEHDNYGRALINNEVIDLDYWNHEKENSGVAINSTVYSYIKNKKNIYKRLVKADRMQILSPGHPFFGVFGDQLFDLDSFEKKAFLENPQSSTLSKRFILECIEKMDHF